MMLVKKILLFVIILITTCSAFGQKDSLTVRSFAVTKGAAGYPADPTVNIFPVPVRDGQMTITAEKEIYSIKITNIIGQDIYKSTPGESFQNLKISLDNPRRGVYIVSVIFADRTRCVKKIMVEGANSN
jgi:hypothetical protein